LKLELSVSIYSNKPASRQAHLLDIYGVAVVGDLGDDNATTVASVNGSLRFQKTAHRRNKFRRSRSWRRRRESRGSVRRWDRRIRHPTRRPIRRSIPRLDRRLIRRSIRRLARRLILRSIRRLIRRLIRQLSLRYR